MVIENEVLTGCAMLGLRTSSIVRVNVSRGFMREVERDIGRLGKGSYTRPWRACGCRRGVKGTGFVGTWWAEKM